VSSLDLARANLTSPIVVAFALGILATLVRSDLRFPEAITTTLSIYLLLAIGIKGGVELSESDLGALWLPTIATLGLGVLTPLVAYLCLRRVVRLSQVDAAAVAAHYGSVSAVTFMAALAFLEAADVPYEGFVTALLALLEVPGIVVALLLARVVTAGETTLARGVAEILAGRSVLLLVGGLVIGALAGREGYEPVEPFFGGIFSGMLVLFLLDLGMLAAQRLGDVRHAGPRLALFAVVFPCIAGAAGVALGNAAGLSLGGATVLGVLAASASYIAAPAAVRVALPEASPSLYLTAALGITFPFNLVLGIPLYFRLAEAIS
jgi:hypothetical protein